MNTEVITLVEAVAPGTAKVARSRREAAKRLEEQGDRLDLMLQELSTLA